MRLAVTVLALFGLVAGVAFAKTPYHDGTAEIIKPTDERNPLTEVVSGYNFRKAMIRDVQDDDFENPGMLVADHGEELWSKVDGSAGKSISEVFEGCAEVSVTQAGAVYPRYHSGVGKVMSLEQIINMCRETAMGAKPYKWEKKFLDSMAWDNMDTEDQEQILETFSTHQRREAGVKEWPVNAEDFKNMFKEVTSENENRIFIAKKALTQSEYENIMAIAKPEDKAKMVLLDWNPNSTKYWVKRKHEEGGVDGYQNNFRHPRTVRLPKESRQLKNLDLPSDGVAINGDVDSGNEETKGGVEAKKRATNRHNLRQISRAFVRRGFTKNWITDFTKMSARPRFQ